MKTKFRTLAAVTALVLIGATNINATADYKKATNENAAIEAEKPLALESWMTDETIWATEINTEAEPIDAEKPLTIEAWMVNEDLWK